MGAPAAQSLASSRSGSYSSFVLWKLFCCTLIEWIINLCWTLYFSIWAGGPMDWANWSRSCVFCISFCQIEAQLKRTELPVQCSSLPVPFGRKAVVGTLIQGHRLWSKILLLTSWIAAVLTALQTCHKPQEEERRMQRRLGWSVKEGKERGPSSCFTAWWIWVWSWSRSEASPGCFFSQTCTLL